MAGEIVAGLSAAKAAIGIAKGLKDINDAAVINAAILDIQSKLIETQEGYLAMQERLKEAEAKIVAYEDWEAIKQRYELVERPPGKMLYALKKDAPGNEPPHYACTNCFSDRQHKILQCNNKHDGREWLNCDHCGALNVIGVSRTPEPEPKPRRLYGSRRV